MSFCGWNCIPVDFVNKLTVDLFAMSSRCSVEWMGSEDKMAVEISGETVFVCFINVYFLVIKNVTYLFLFHVYLLPIFFSVYFIFCLCIFSV